MNFQQPTAFVPINGGPFLPAQNGFIYIQQNPSKILNNKIKPNHDDLKARNRIAAKKWRDKKDEVLSQLEAANDDLRKEALQLRNEVMSLKTETQVLEDELRYFQSFMSRIMNKTTTKTNTPLPSLEPFPNSPITAPQFRL